MYVDWIGWIFNKETIAEFVTPPTTSGQKGPLLDSS